MHPRRHVYLGTVFTLAVCRLAVADPPAADKFDPDRFNALSGEQKVSLVMSVLDARDRKLSNFKYALRETCTNVNKETGDRRFMFNSEYEVRRLGPRLWMHLTNYEFGSDEDEIRSEGTVTWDGKLAVNLVTPRTARATHNTASVRGRPNDNFWLKKFNELLGLRVQVGNDGGETRRRRDPLPEWDPRNGHGVLGRVHRPARRPPEIGAARTAGQADAPRAPKDPVTALPVAEAAKLYTSEPLNTADPPAKASEKPNDDRP